MLINVKNINKSLKIRLLFWVWLISSLATFAFTSIQLFMDYSREEYLALNQITVINTNYIPSINKSLWDYNIDYLELQLESLRTLPYVKMAKVISQDIDKADKNIIDTKDLMIKSIPLFYGDKKIGVLEVGLDIAGIQRNFLTKMVYIFLTQGFKTLIVCFVLLKIFEHIILRHITKIADYLNDFKLNDENILDLGRSSKIDDEFSMLERSINRFKNDLSQNNKILNNLNSELEQKVLERSKLLDEERARSMQSAKLASLGEMAGGIAHEINNPLAIISSTIIFMKKMIEKKKLSEELLLESIADIEATISRISKIITGLRSVSRNSDNFDENNVKIRDIFDDVLGLCSEKFKNNGVAIHVSLESPLFDNHIKCDRVQLSQVLLNLLGNAFDAIQPLADKWVRIDLEEEQSQHMIRITDSGQGIPAEIAEKIFNPFFTSKEVGKGTGLGLSISKSIMSKHGGSIEIDSTSVNTSFVLRLNRA
jgi:signal transduction histidine kinase